MSNSSESNLTERDHERIDAYLHDLLTNDEAERFEQDCQSCPALKAALGEAGKRLEALQSVPPTEAPDALVKQTIQRIDRHTKARSRYRAFIGLGAIGVAAAAALLIGLLNLHYENLAPSPYNLELLGQTALLANTDASLRVRLTNRSTGAPQSGVPVDIVLTNRNAGEPLKLASFTTDDLGTGKPRFKLPDWADGNYELKVIARTPGQPEETRQNITLKRSWKLMLSTDKPVYQPGQTIHLRSLALRRPDLKPVAGHDVTFTITDPKGNVIFKRKDVTSKFGIAAADCELATEINTGNYRVECQVGDTKSEATVEVLRYVLPKFRVTIEIEETFYKPGDKVKGSVFANYFFGKPVAGAVELLIQTNEIKPTTLKSYNVRLNLQGESPFEFTLPEKLVGTEQDSGDARFNVVAKVVDMAGQEQSRRVSRIVTNSPLRVEIIPENGTLVRGVPNQVYVYVSYANGRPAKEARLKITGVERELTTSDLGVAAFELKPEADDVEVTVSASDEAGAAGKRTVRLQTSSVASQDFLVRTDKAVYNGGETLRLAALGGGVEPIFVDFIRDDQTIVTATVDLKDGKGEYTFDLPAELFGTIDIVAYRFAASGLPVRKSRVIYVKQAGQLKISTIFSQEAFRPGERAKMTLELTDDKGQPRPGAISLAAVDEAVFSVLSQAPGMERTFFTLEQERLKPVYAIYDWTPDRPSRGPREDRIQFEQALFSRTVERADTPLWAVNNDGTQAARPAIPSGDPASVFSLWTNSYPLKANLIRQQRAEGLETVHNYWWWYGIGVAVMLYLALWVYVRPLWIVFALHGIVAVFLCGGFMMLLLTIGGCGMSAKLAPESRLVGFSDVAAVLNGAAAPEPRAAEAGDTGSGQGSGAVAPRVREYFPETLFWRPEIITDDSGLAEIEVDLADSITTWRLTASAVTSDGQLGGLQSSLRVYQPFFVDLNLPVSLTRGDEVGIPVVINNYLNQEQEVELKLEKEDWFELLEGELEQKITLDPSAVRSVSYRIKVKGVGQHTLQVTAKSRIVADAIKRPIEVIPDGLAIEQLANGNLPVGRAFSPSGGERRVENPSYSLDINLPAEAIEGSGKLLVKVYPSSFSQLVEGLEGLFQQPYGCFEQTSSTTYPNVLALDYLRRTKKSVPDVEAKARQYIHLGYQRLLGFEVAGGGFDWFGNPPANRVLTAYGLMEFQDMAKVHDVDPNLISRTRDWLLRQRAPEGWWTPERHKLHADPTNPNGDAELEKYATTAYLAWAVFGDIEARSASEGRTDPRAAATRSYLLARQPDEFQDPYILALAGNALRVCGTQAGELRPYLDRLESLKRTSADGKLAWWEQPRNTRTMFYGEGGSGAVETTATAALALIEGRQHSATVRAALSWIVQQRKNAGTFGSTQATVLALKSLLAGTDAPLGGDKERRVQIALGDVKKEIVIPTDQSEVMQLVNLSEHLHQGNQRLTLTETSGTGAGFQVVFRHHIPEPDIAPAREPLTIALEYDKNDLAVGDVVTATAAIVNNLPTPAPMVILDLPIPAGFTVVPEDWQELVKDKTIDKFQVNPRSVVVYLRSLQPNRTLRLSYQLKATMPVKVTVPPAKVYEYYNAEKQGRSKALGLTVKE